MSTQTERTVADARTRRLTGQAFQALSHGRARTRKPVVQQATQRDLRNRMLAGLHIDEQRLNIGGVATSVLVAGQGPPLVLLHGGIECGGVYWAPVIARLAARHRVIVPDVPGLGESAPVSTLDQAVFAEWFSALLQRTCSQTPMLVAHSLLGTFAARYATRHGNQLHSLVIYGAPGIGPYRMPLGLMITALRFELRPTARNNQRFEAFALLDRARTRARDVDWFDAFSAYSLARARVPHVKRTMHQLIQLGTRQVPDDELRRIQLPTTLLWGRHDRMTPLKLAHDARKRLGWPLRVIDDVAHVPHLEQPDAFVDVLHDDN